MKIILFVILTWFISFAVAGTDLVLNLDGIIVQGIPVRSASFFEATQVITLSTGKKFVKLPQAEHLLSKLQKSGLVDKVILTGTRSASENTEILKGFPSVDQSFFEVRGDELESFLSKTLSQGERLILVSEKDLKGTPQGGAEVVVLKPTFYHFTTYDAAKAEAAKVKPELLPNFPASVDEWELHLTKRGRLYYILLSALETGAVSLKKLLADNAKVQGNVGDKLLLSHGKWTTWSWNKTGCEKHDLKTGLKASIVDLHLCAKNLQTIKYWEGQAEKVCLIYSDAQTLVGKLGPEVCSDIETHRIEIRDQVFFVKSFQGLANLSTQEIINRFGRTASFRNLLKQPGKASNMTSELGAACVAAINKITAEGKTLASSVLQKSIKPLSSIRFSSGLQDSLFYHWTKGSGLTYSLKLGTLDAKKAFEENSRDGTFESMFDFLRTRSVDMYQFWRRVFYVAEDTESSKFLGDILVTFDLDLKSPTISYDQNVWQSSLTEVADRYPELKASCKMDLSWRIPDTFGQVYFDNIFFIVAEDSGVEVVDYNQQQKWFQLLSPRPIKGIKLGP